jgi:DNA invertase Pin-like site-specific DNA recombinase
MAHHAFIYVRQTGTQPELVRSLRHTVENRGDNVVAVHADDSAITGRGKFAAWRTMVADLNAVDQIVISDAGDIPGRTVADLLKILAILRDHGVGLYLHTEHIDTTSTTFALLDIIAAYRAAKLSQAIRAGQMRARAAGKTIGRPIVPLRVQDRIRSALTDGGGIRPTARRFGVSPASVINIRRSMTVSQCISHPVSTQETAAPILSRRSSGHRLYETEDTDALTI